MTRNNFRHFPECESTGSRRILKFSQAGSEFYAPMSSEQGQFQYRLAQKCRDSGWSDSGTLNSSMISPYPSESNPCDLNRLPSFTDKNGIARKLHLQIFRVNLRVKLVFISVIYTTFVLLHLQLSTLHLRAKFTLHMQLDAIFVRK